MSTAKFPVSVLHVCPLESKLHVWKTSPVRSPYWLGSTGLADKLVVQPPAGGGPGFTAHGTKLASVSSSVYVMPGVTVATSALSPQTSVTPIKTVPAGGHPGENRLRLSALATGFPLPSTKIVAVGPEPANNATSESNPPAEIACPAALVPPPNPNVCTVTEEPSATNVSVNTFSGADKLPVQEMALPVVTHE